MDRKRPLGASLRPAQIQVLRETMPRASHFEEPRPVIRRLCELGQTEIVLRLRAKPILHLQTPDPP
jgi:hypothetical protein